MKKYFILLICLFPVVVFAAAPPAPSPDGFDAWVKEFKKEAITKGIKQKTLDDAFKNVKFNQKVIDLDRRQAEFKLNFWEYLDRMVNNAKVNTGKSLRKKYRTLLKRVEEKYGVPSQYIIAFWGVESNFGIHFGGFNIIESLATLSYDTRRPELFKHELINALKIMQEQKIEPDDMKGSWAGAMGNFQFLPSTFMRYAVDFDGDGKKDIWKSIPDSFASAANYLSKMGWERNQRWGREIYLPDNLSWVRLNRKLTRTAEEWKKAEIKPADKGIITKSKMEGTIIFPGGHKGPIFLTYPNFKVITNWNRSVLYAVAVGHFADRVSGAKKLYTKRTKLRVPSKAEIIEAQNHLIEMGFYDGKADGILGSGSKEAVRIAQQRFDLPIDGYLSPELLKKMRNRK